mmetsp:Transcript_103605/g.302376  ORF Transcript_103605/g.302376 Transcript_103605/m.302376 type:complete len:202 (+) Transcript_103605:161-766(+)
MGPLDNSADVCKPLVHVDALPFRDKANLTVKKDYLQVLIEGILVRYCVQNLLHIFRSTCLHLLDVQMSHSAKVLGQMPARRYHNALLQSQRESFCHFCNTPGSAKNIKVGIHCNSLIELRLLSCQEADHISELVHLARDSFAPFCAEWCRCVEELGPLAPANLVRNVRHRIRMISRIGSTNGVVLRQGEGTHPVCGLQHPG